MRMPRRSLFWFALILVVTLLIGCSSPGATPAPAVVPTDVPAPTEAVAPTEAPATAMGDVERGHYLASVYACMDCHTGRAEDGVQLDQSKLLAGGEVFPGPWGTAVSLNVTAAAHNYDAATLERLIRGQERYLRVMPTAAFNQMATQDMQDLIAYLQSLEVVDNALPPSEANPDFQAPPVNQPVDVPATAPAGVGVERGAYLVVQAGCNDCHTPIGETGPDMAHSLSGGSIPFPGADGAVFFGPNLTPDEATGLGAWTDEEIITAIRTGVASDGHQLSPVMPYASAYHVMSDEDAMSIVAYLRSLPPTVSENPENPQWAPAPE